MYATLHIEQKLDIKDHKYQLSYCVYCTEMQSRQSVLRLCIYSLQYFGGFFHEKLDGVGPVQKAEHVKVETDIHSLTSYLAPHVIFPVLTLNPSS